MTFIPNKYKAEEGKTPETGSVEVACKICGQKFWVPADLIPQLGTTPVCENESCKEAIEKAQADIAAIQAKQSVDTTSDSLTDKAKQI